MRRRNAPSVSAPKIDGDRQAGPDQNDPSLNHRWRRRDRSRKSNDRCRARGGVPPGRITLHERLDSGARAAVYSIFVEMTKEINRLSTMCSGDLLSALGVMMSDQGRKLVGLASRGRRATRHV